MLLPQSKEDFLVLCEGPTQGLDDTTITTETKHFTNFTRSKEVCMIIEATIFYLSMLQKYINSKQKTLKLESKYFVVMKKKKKKKKKKKRSYGLTLSKYQYWILEGYHVFLQTCYFCGNTVINYSYQNVYYNIYDMAKSLTQNDHGSI